jgi:hypothetical protein
LFLASVPVDDNLLSSHPFRLSPPFFLPSLRERSPVRLFCCIILHSILWISPIFFLVPLDVDKQH